MEDIKELLPAFQSLVSQASDIDLSRVIPADQGRAAPSGNAIYATYKPVPIRAYGQVRRRREHIAPIEAFDESLGSVWTDLQEIACTSMEFMLSVNIFNEGADSAVMRLHNANFRMPISEFLFRNNIAWRYASNCINLTGMLQAGIQPRWRTDIHLFIEQTVSYAVLRAAGFEVQIKERDSYHGLSG
ncbi:Uncharacterised protein [Yersinia pseudotuberculosis]|uniref:phage neck terminator protein n=1 Tax=Yersinia pseudotuberculosis TaxID=633 RepID=UPI0005E8EF2C|nr:hypothetical protein [Yersinia pseudotuberculosis]CNL65359.1 Uncharacterised protein [Yersinia pseudotuberculosis]